MKRLILAALLLPGAAIAAEPAPAPAPMQPPPTMALPTQLIFEIRKYLGSRPYDEIQALVYQLDGCVIVQGPHPEKAFGACPLVAHTAAGVRKASGAAGAAAEIHGHQPPAHAMAPDEPPTP